MSRYLLILFFFTAGALLASSCAQLRDTAVDKEEQPEEQPSAPEEPEVEVAEIPPWHNPAGPVELTLDSLFVSAAAVAADSSDALAIAELALLEYTNNGITGIIILLLEEQGQGVLDDPGSTTASGEQREMLIRLMTLGDEDLEEIRPDSRQVFWHHENGQVRCYIRHAYDRSALDALVRAHLQ